MASEQDRIDEARRHALSTALDYYVDSPDSSRVAEDVIIRSAAKFLPFLLARTTQLTILVSPNTFSLRNPSSHRETKYTEQGDGTMAVTMTDTEYVTLTAAPMDADGNPTADTGLTWTADNPAMVNLVPSADGTQVNVGAVPTAGELGTVNITLKDGAGLVSGAEAIVITGGSTTSLGISASAPQAIPSTGVPTPTGTSAS